MMKKLLCLLLAIAISFSLNACAGPQEENPGQGTKLVFTTNDTDGNTWTEQNLSGYKLVMINFWATWCGACVSEMPDLERLYQAYRDEGLLILGVSGSDGKTDNAAVAQIRSDTGVTYPNLLYTEAFAPLLSDYLPTTVFLSEDGIICGNTVIGAKSYEDWVGIIENLL